ncbi:MAG: porin [Kiritimatiellia bacterium]
MNTKLLKTLTGAVIVGTMMTTTLSAQDKEVVLVIPDKGDVVKLKATGRMHFQFGYVDQENDSGSDDWSTFEVRRARIGLSGSFGNNIKAQVEANVKPSETNVSSATLTWAKNDALNVTAGFDKPMSSLEENTSSASILTVERSNVNNTIAAPGETTGLWVNGESGIFFYHAGIYNGEDVDSARNESGTKAEYLFNLHGGATFNLSEGSKLTAMISYLDTEDAEANSGYDDTTTVALHFKAGAIDVRAEYFMASEGSEDIDGFYIMPSMKLNKSLEAVVRFEASESDSGSGIRAPSRYARRSELADGADRGDEFTAIYLGMNYYFQKYNKIMLGIEFSELDNTEAGSLDTTSLFGAYRVRF